MAGSNWEQLAFDGAGKRHKPTLRVGDATLDIYKNWVYVQHTGMWVDDGNFVRPTIARIWEGEIQLAGFGITAARSAIRQAIFVVEHDDCGTARFSGLGCYGFSDDGKWEGVTDELFEAFLDWLRDHARNMYRDAVRFAHWQHGVKPR